VTSWAAILAVPTAITGVYGQNLPYPGFSRTSGFYASTLVIIVMSGLLYILFKRKDRLYTQRHASYHSGCVLASPRPAFLCGGPRWLPAQGALPASAG
jgi:hypothetical protein